MGAVWFLVSALLVSALPNALQPAGGAVTSGTLPNLLIQYGQPRTATTLQFQTLCAIALVMNKADPSRVVCSFLPPTKPGENVLKGKAADQTALHVVKTHTVPAEGFPKDAWLFASEIDDTVGADDPWEGAAERMSQELGHHVKYAQVMSRLAERGSGIAKEYQPFFGLSDAQIEEVVTYLRYWDILRMCCGAQMDDGYRTELGGGVGASPAAGPEGPGSYLMTAKPENCHSYDIQAIEQHAVQTEVFKLALKGGKGSAYLRSTSSLEADKGYELTGKYCVWFNKEVTCQKLDFNRLPERPGCSGEQPPAGSSGRSESTTRAQQLPMSTAEPESGQVSTCGDWCAPVGGSLRQGDDQCGWEGCKGCKGCAEDDAGGSSVTRPGVLTPLLAWTSHEGAPVKLELSGLTFSAESLETEESVLRERAEGAQCQHGIKRHLNSAQQLAAGSLPSGSFACCPAACGQCGGGGCEDKPGGSLQCCVYGLVASNQVCQNATSVACLVHAAAAAASQGAAGAGARPKGPGGEMRTEREFLSLARKAEEAQLEGAKGQPALGESARPALLSKARAQWFGQLTLKAFGMTVLNVSRGEGGFGEMVVEVDGKPVARGRKASHNVIDQVFTSKLGVRTTLKAGEEHVGDAHGQALVVEAPSFKFSIESRPASTFPKTADQLKYGHLILKFDPDALNQPSEPSLLHEKAAPLGLRLKMVRDLMQNLSPAGDSSWGPRVR